MKNLKIKIPPNQTLNPTLEGVAVGFSWERVSLDVMFTKNVFTSFIEGEECLGQHALRSRNLAISNQR